MSNYKEVYGPFGYSGFGGCFLADMSVSDLECGIKIRVCLSKFKDAGKRKYE